jgi:hypothetical protein
MRVAHLKVSGSQLGECIDAAAGGKAFAIGGIDILRMKDGHIAEDWGLIHTAAMTSRFGL